MKKLLLLFLASLLLLSAHALAAGTDTVTVAGEKLGIRDYRMNDDRTSYTVTVDGYNALLTGKSGVFTDIMPFRIGIAWSPDEYVIASSFAITMEPVTIANLAKEDGSAMEEPLYILIAPKGTRINRGYYYVIAEQKFYSWAAFEKEFIKKAHDPRENPDAIKTPGKYVVFGCYPLETGDRPLPIEWIVLDYDPSDGSSLLISRYGLACKKYHEEDTPVTWEYCSLREWLNGEFIGAAFTPEEQTVLLQTELASEYDPAGNSTLDRVFLLSEDEALNRYFTDDASRVCGATEYAISMTNDRPEKELIDEHPVCPWWIRTPKESETAYQKTVDPSGDVGAYSVTTKRYIRPVIRIKADSDWSRIMREVMVPPTPTPTPEPTPAPTPTPRKDAVSPKEHPEALRVPGEYVTFGNYIQSNKKGSEPEPIEWLVLDYDEEGHRSLLLSRYSLEVMPFDKAKKTNVWEKCSLRKWLNKEFISKAFTPEEEAAILLTEVDNSAAQGIMTETKDEKNTEDRVFLLSYHEAFDLYFYNDAERVCGMTNYVKYYGNSTRVGKKTPDGGTAWSWYLRSPNKAKDSISEVYEDGILIGAAMKSSNDAVRPALWVDVESGLFGAPDPDLVASMLETAHVKMTPRPTEEPTPEPAPAPETAPEPAEQAVSEAVDPAGHPEALKTIGSYVLFGTYPQTAEGKDKTPVEWLVLDYDEAGHRALLLSRYGLDAAPFDNKKTSQARWEECSLRKWLNGTFLKKAFSQKQQAAVLNLEVDNSQEQGYYVTYGQNQRQKSKVFLLSYHEAFDLYFKDDLSRRCGLTDWAVAQGARASSLAEADGRPAALGYWLRSPARSSFYSMYVGCFGLRGTEHIDDKHIAVRPAVWVDVEAKCFK